MRQGSGRETWPNGDLYEGEWRGDLRHGRGALKSRGGWYRGDFAEGRKRGGGTMAFNNGAGYDGAWADNRFEGEGTYTWPDNRR